jgi:hypothetical protein
MAICPKCGTENKDNAPFCVNCRQILPKKLKKLKPQQQESLQNVREQLPGWLHHLLEKYGEPVGPLVGLEDATATQ